MSRRESLWLMLRDLVLGNPSTKAQQRVDDAIKAHAKAASDAEYHMIYLRHVEQQIRTTDPNVDWHGWAKLKDEEEEQIESWAKARADADRASGKTLAAMAALRKIKGTQHDAAAPAHLGDFSAAVAKDAKEAINRHLYAVDSTAGAGDAGTAAGVQDH